MKLTKTTKKIEIELEEGETWDKVHHKEQTYNSENYEVQQIWITAFKLTTLLIILLITSCSSYYRTVDQYPPEFIIYQQNKPVNI